MREIQAPDLTKAVRDLCIDANYNLPEDVVQCFRDSLEIEESDTGKAILNELLENAEIAKTEQVPYCQDTGFAILYVDLGQDVHVVGGDFNEALEEGVRQGYADGYLRKSIVRHGLDRKNTGDNTPCLSHLHLVPGDRIEITIVPKGGGSENMSQLKMMKPSDGRDGVRDFVVQTVREAGPNPCPPLVVGVGIGGTFDHCAALAKKAIFRGIGTRSENPIDRGLEEELLELCNKVGVGPAGYGGRVTVLDVHMESFPCHIASMPVAVNIQCHAARHKTVVL
jgi:fumarate hydratase subunit alpha